MTMSTIQFFAESVTVQAQGVMSVHVTLDADMKNVVEDMDLEDRLHQVEPSDVVEQLGAVSLLNAMGEQHFDQWVKANGDYYEALNAIGIEKIQEWVNDYCNAE